MLEQNTGWLFSVVDIVSVICVNQSRDTNLCKSVADIMLQLVFPEKRSPGQL